MSLPQTSVANPAIAIAGQLADNTLGKDCLSKINGEASAEIPFGVMVGKGSADDEVLKLAAASDKLAGVSVYGAAYARTAGGATLELGSTGLTPNTLMDVLNVGRIYVFPEDAVTPASEVHVRAVAGGSEVAGAFRGTAYGTDTINVSAFCRWITSGSSSTPAVVEIDMRNAAQAVADT